MNHIHLFESFDRDLNLCVVNEETATAEEKKIEKDLDELFKKLVPGNGSSDTEEGEMVRAIMRIWYRYFNDGDYFFRGYGKETALPSVNYLKQKSPLGKELRPIFAAAQQEAGRPDNDDEYTDKDGYLKNIRKATELIVKYVQGKDGKYTPNKEDSRF